MPETLKQSLDNVLNELSRLIKKSYPEKQMQHYAHVDFMKKSRACFDALKQLQQGGIMPLLSADRVIDILLKHTPRVFHWYYQRREKSFYYQVSEENALFLMLIYEQVTLFKSYCSNEEMCSFGEAFDLVKKRMERYHDRGSQYAHMSNDVPEFNRGKYHQQLCECYNLSLDASTTLALRSGTEHQLTQDFTLQATIIYKMIQSFLSGAFVGDVVSIREGSDARFQDGATIFKRKKKATKDEVNEAYSNIIYAIFYSASCLDDREQALIINMAQVLIQKYPCIHRTSRSLPAVPVSGQHRCFRRMLALPREKTISSITVMPVPDEEAGVAPQKPPRSGAGKRTPIAQAVCMQPPSSASSGKSRVRQRWSRVESVVALPLSVSPDVDEREADTVRKCGLDPLLFNSGLMRIKGTAWSGRARNEQEGALAVLVKMTEKELRPNSVNIDDGVSENQAVVLSRP
jgi:hypothetical protein